MSTSKENKQVDSSSVLTIVEDEKNADVEIAEKEITKVIWKYLDFLQVIAINIKEIMNNENQKKERKEKILSCKKGVVQFSYRTQKVLQHV